MLYQPIDIDYPKQSVITQKTTLHNGFVRLATPNNEEGQQFAVECRPVSSSPNRYKIYFEGALKDGKYEGAGLLNDDDNNFKYIGYFRQGLMNGYGLLSNTFSQNDMTSVYYFGHFENGISDGLGTLLQNYGKHWVYHWGAFKDGLFNELERPNMVLSVGKTMIKNDDGQWIVTSNRHASTDEPAPISLIAKKVINEFLDKSKVTNSYSSVLEKFHFASVCDLLNEVELPPGEVPPREVLTADDVKVCGNISGQQNCQDMRLITTVSDNLRWKLGDTKFEDGRTACDVLSESLKSTLANTPATISIGTASREGDVSEEAERAGERAELISQCIKDNVITPVGESPKRHFTLNMGRHKDTKSTGDTRDQRKLYILAFVHKDETLLNDSTVLEGWLKDAMLNGKVTALTLNPDDYFDFKVLQRQ